MTVLEWWVKTLTSEDIFIFARFGFDCKDCPANMHCNYLCLENGKKLCDNYSEFCNYLNSEV